MTARASAWRVTYFISFAISTTGPSARSAVSTSQESRERLASNGSNIAASLLRLSTAVGQSVARDHVPAMGKNDGISKSGGGAARVIAVIVFIVVVAAAIVVPIAKKSDSFATAEGAKSTEPSRSNPSAKTPAVKTAPTPKAWDPRVAPLVETAARLRGLDF